MPQIRIDILSREGTESVEYGEAPSRGEAMDAAAEHLKGREGETYSYTVTYDNQIIPVGAVTFKEAPPDPEFESE